ncbi:hypothetical protein HDU96_008649, partial [Phlyctochytrium bullatum]
RLKSIAPEELTTEEPPKPKRKRKAEGEDRSIKTKKAVKEEKPEQSKTASELKHSSDDESKPADHQSVQYFLMKAEPDSRIVNGIDVKFSIDDLKAKGSSSWDGVRNHEAKNIMKSMRVGDLALFYHSNCKTPGIAGLCKIVKEAYPDHTAWEKGHPYFDVKSDAKNPRWFMVDVEYVRHLEKFLPLKLLQQQDGLKDMALIKRGRLSVQRVTQAEFEFILSMEKEGVSE